MVDKSGKPAILLNKFFGRAFIWAKGDQFWKDKRKASAHAFYKERVTFMTNALK